MTTEEKAKAYDEALDRAKKELDACGSQDCDAARQIFRLFPELKESEDERIRKALINVFASHKGYEIFYGVSVEDILAWLEKRGTSYTKRDVDDAYLKGVCDAKQELEKQSEPIKVNPTEFDLRLNRLLKQFESLPKEELASSLSFYLNVVQNDGTYKQKPTDNDMVEALRTEYEKGRADAIAEMQEEWSEDDEEMLTEIITDVKFAQERNPQSQMNQIIFEEEINWLKSLKVRYTWKPSDEQMELLKDASARYEGLELLYNDLKKLKGE